MIHKILDEGQTSEQYVFVKEEDDIFSLITYSDGSTEIVLSERLTEINAD